MTLDEAAGQYFSAQTEQAAILRLFQKELKAAQDRIAELEKQIAPHVSAPLVPANS